MRDNAFTQTKALLICREHLQRRPEDNQAQGHGNHEFDQGHAALRRGIADCHACQPFPFCEIRFR